MTQPTVVVENLRHAFGEHVVLQDVSFTVQAGEIFGLLGPNGAGKTTTIRLLNGLYEPRAGHMRVLGLDPAQNGSQVRAQCGVLTETPALYEVMTARENLAFFGGLAGLSKAELHARINETLTFFELAGRADDKVAKYSKGMKQRLALARAVLAHPRVLYLDEPTSSLDPESALQVRDLIESLARKEGCSVFLCTHHLADAQRLCDQMAILRQGHILDQGSLEQLNQRHNPGVTVRVELDGPYNPALIPPGAGLTTKTVSATTIELHLKDESSIPDLVTALVQNGARIRAIQPLRASLEDIYFRLQGSNEEIPV